MKSPTIASLSQEDHYVCKHEKCQRGSLRLVAFNTEDELFPGTKKLRSFVRAVFWLDGVHGQFLVTLAEVAARGEGPCIQVRSSSVF